MKMLVSAANESVGKACLPSEIKNFSNPKERILVICIKNLKKKKNAHILWPSNSTYWNLSWENKWIYAETGNNVKIQQ